MNGGNHWASWCGFLSFWRDVVGLDLPEYNAYAHYENLALHSGWRYVHEKFCMISDRPQVLRTIVRDGIHVAHCEDGPTHRWADGWSLWHVGGVKVDEQIVMQPETQTIGQIKSESNEEVKRVRISRFAGRDAGELEGWSRYLKEIGAIAVNRRRNPIDNTLEALFRCPDGMTVAVLACRSTARKYALEVPRDVQTCEEAQAWMRSGSWLDRTSVKRRMIAAG